ncbi:cholinergic receptor, nicotinic, beta 1 (muscle) like [Embiotoca jacksoni]|uniref:cholinergic receptor, nicotinic, beta 1 (muscle) like n=1 Tax=Embiotoca jacksoni TaxID=100190 RepID=UPI0037037A4B
MVLLKNGGMPSTESGDEHGHREGRAAVGDVTTRAVLTQATPGGERVVAHHSRTSNEAERRYRVTGRRWSAPVNPQEAVQPTGDYQLWRKNGRGPEVDSERVDLQDPGETGRGRESSYHREAGKVHCTAIDGPLIGARPPRLDQQMRHGEPWTLLRDPSVMVPLGSLVTLFPSSCSCLFASTFSNPGASETERRLHQKIFQNYNMKVRPARNWEDKVMVRVGMTLSQLVSLNEKNGEMTTNVFMNLAWTDYRLSWNPEEYDDIDVLRIPPNKVWRPDIYLINNNDGQFDVALYVNVLVHSDGTVKWLPPAIYRSSCSIEVAYFPFDWQNCSMVFRSYTYDASEVDLQYFLNEDGNEIHDIVIDENAFTENGEWAICHTPSRKNVKEDLYEDITFYLIIQRKPLFYIINIILPCILTSVLAIFVFYLPPGAGEKMTLSISVLIALTVFMLLLADRVPETSLAIPIIVNYVMFTMILVTFSVILSVVVLNLHHRTPSTHIMPNWVRKVFIHFLPKYIGMMRPNPEEPLLKESNGDTPTRSFNGRQPGGEYFFRKINPDLVIPWRDRCESTVQLRRLPNTDGYCLILPPNLKSAIAAVTYVAEQLKKQDTDDAMTGDWQFIALVVDRLFLWLFVIITTLGTLAMFLDASFNYTPDNPFP